MPRIPTAESLGIRDPSASYRAPSYQGDDPVAAAQGRMGAALSGLGNTLTGIASREMDQGKKDRDLLEWARADAYIASQTAKLNEARDQENDPDRLGGYEGAQKKIVDDAARGLSDPTKAALWRTKHEPTITNQGLNARSRATTLRNNAGLAADEQTIHDMYLGVEKVKTPEELSEVIGRGRNLIELQRRNGLIDARRAGEAQRNLSERFLSRFVQTRTAAEQLQILGPDEDEPTGSRSGPATLSTRDRDLVIRTVIGESRGQPLAGQVGVAHVIKNRVAVGGYGSTPSDVVLKPKQFEPWTTRRGELLAIDPNSDLYKQVGSFVDRVWAGQEADPTNGATHFANVDTVRQRGDAAGRPGGWLGGMSNVRKIGSHTFGNADAGRDAAAVQAAAGGSGGATVQKASVDGDAPAVPGAGSSAPKLMRDSTDRFQEALKATPDKPMDQILGAKDWDDHIGFFSGPDGKALTARAAAAKMAAAPPATAPASATKPGGPAPTKEDVQRLLDAGDTKAAAEADAARVASEGGPRIVLGGGAPLATAARNQAAGAEGIETGPAPDSASAPAARAPLTPLQVAISQLPWETRRRLRQEARTLLGQQERDTERQAKVQRAELDAQIRDDLTSMANTGKGLSDLTPERVGSVLGLDAANQWQASRERARRSWEVFDGSETLSEGELGQRLEKLLPAAGTPGYAENIKAYDDARKQMDRILQARRIDPAASVDDFPLVKQAKQAAEYIQTPDGKRMLSPGSARRITQARLDAQERLGIIEPSAVTKAQAAGIARALRGAGDDEVKIGAVVKTLHDMYGDLADEVLISTIQTANVNRDLAADATESLNRLVRGERTRAEQARKSDMLRDDQRATDAMAGAPPARIPTPPSYDSYGGWAEPEPREPAPSSPSPTTPAPASRGAGAVAKAAPDDKMPELGGSVSGAELKRLWDNRNDPDFIRAFDDTYGKDQAKKVLRLIERTHPEATSR